MNHFLSFSIKRRPRAVRLLFGALFLLGMLTLPAPALAEGSILPQEAVTVETAPEEAAEKNDTAAEAPAAEPLDGPSETAAETPELPPSAESPAADKAEGEPSPTFLQRLARGFSLHKQTYAIFTWGNRAAGMEDSELKFQFSFKQRLGESGFFIAYTQKSFWRVFDQSDSRPFRETNYNPEAFYRTARPTRWGSWGGDLGLEHESNGSREPDSRSWNRAYLAPYLEVGRVRAELKLWQRLSEEVKEDPLDPTGDENPDIEDFYGHGELRLSCRVGKRQQANLMLRGNTRTGKGAVQFDYSIPTPLGIDVYAQLWSGYGESLIDYDRSLTTYGLGIRFRP